MEKLLKTAKNSLKTEQRIKDLFKGSNFASIIQKNLKRITDEQIIVFLHDKNLEVTVSPFYGIFSFYKKGDKTPLTGEQINLL